MNSNYDCVRYTPKFTDMGNHWLTKQGWTEVSIASGFLVPEDYPKQIFHPNTPIYRYSIAVMTDRAMGLVLPSMQPLAEPLTFTDQAQIQDWPKATSSRLPAQVFSKATQMVVLGQRGLPPAQKLS